MNNNTEKIYKAKVCRQDWGDISPMTEWRWQQQGFPKPIKINGKNYYTHSQRFEEAPRWILQNYQK